MSEQAVFIESLLAVAANELKLKGVCQLPSQIVAQTMVTRLQKEFPGIAYVYIGRGGYDSFVYTEDGRKWLVEAISKWLKNDIAKLENTCRILHSLGFQVPELTIK